MKIFLISNHNPFFQNTNFYREKAIRDLGHTTIFFNTRGYIFHPRLRQNFPVLQTIDLRRINDDLIRRVKNARPDICIVAGGTEILPDTVREIRALKVPVALWTSDVPRPDQFDTIIASAPEYSQVFCAGSEAIPIIKERTGIIALWLPFACDPDCHAPVQLTAEDQKRFSNDIAFVGSYYPNRARIFETLSDKDIKIWGPLWSRLPKDSPIKTKAVDTRLNFDIWRKIYAAAGIVLVVHFNDDHTPCFQASPKLFEAMACGAFVLVDDQKDARALFTDDEHVVFFKNGTDLREKISFYLTNPELRKIIAANGRLEVLAKHTYKHRINEIIERTLHA